MIRYENKIPVDDYLRLREMAGWMKISRKQAENAVNNCFYSVCVWDDNKVIGIMRILWNGDYCAYISDVIVDEAYRGQKIASTMMKQSIHYLKSQMEDDFVVRLFLMAAKGRESFYEQFGFVQRPNDSSGAALDQWVYKDE